MERMFRAFAEKEDLQAVFQAFEDQLDVYYVPTYSDEGEISYASVTNLENLGLNFNGCHLGQIHLLAFEKTTPCLWCAYQCERQPGQYTTRYTSVGTGNMECIWVDLNGIHPDHAIFPTEISTMYYEYPGSKKLFLELKKVFRRQSVKTVGGNYILPKAYADRDKYRFCPMDLASPSKYDLIVE